MSSPRARTEPGIRFLAGAGVLTVAYLLKLHYSRASSEELAWIIGPTVLVTEAVSGLSFTREPGYGWLDASHNVVVAPACAGVNFLIIALCASAWLVIRSRRSGRTLFTGIAAAGFASYLLTLAANASRILLTTVLYELGIHIGPLTPESLHRIAGTVIYYLFLCGFVLAIDRSMCGASNAPLSAGAVEAGPKPRLLTLPLCCYLLFSIGVPLLNDALENHPKLFIEHAGSVVCVVVVITLGLFVIHHLVSSATRRFTRTL